MWGGGEPEGQWDDDIDKAFFVEMVPLEAFVQVEGEGATSEKHAEVWTVLSRPPRPPRPPKRVLLVY